MWSADITFTVCTSCRIISSSHCCMWWLIPSSAASIECTCACTVWSFLSRAAIFSCCSFSDAISLAILPNLSAFFAALSGCWSSMLNSAFSSSSLRLISHSVIVEFGRIPVFFTAASVIWLQIAPLESITELIAAMIACYRGSSSIVGDWWQYFVP